MCMEDVKLGRKLDARVFPELSSVSGTVLLVAADSNRTRLIVCGYSAAEEEGLWACGVSDSPTLGAGVWFVLNNNAPHYVFRVEEFGSLVTGPIWIQQMQNQTFNVRASALRLTNVDMDK